MKKQFTTGLNKDDFQEGKQLGMLNEILLNTIQEIQDLVFVVKVTEGPSFRYVYMNAKAREHVKMDRDYYGKTFEEMVGAEEAQALTATYGQVLEKREAVRYQDHHADRGTISYYESLLNPIFDASGTCEYIVCITRNVTEHVQRQEKLLESQMRYQSLLDYNHDSILSLDVDGRIMYTNPATYSIFGYHPDALHSQYVFHVLLAEAKEELEQAFQQTLTGQAISIESHRCRHQDGRELHVSIKMIPIVIRENMMGVYLVVHDITEQVQNELKTKYYAYYDQLTGLLNHVSFIKRLADYIEDRQPFSIFSIDLDELHIVNDLAGHECGDEVLRETAKRLQGVIPKGADLFRQHGDQFILLTWQARQTDIDRTAEKLLESMRKPFILKGEEFFIGISIGAVTYPQDGENGQALLRRADLALERAREQGKASYASYHSVLDEERERRFILEYQLAIALEKNEFSLYYQPQVHIMTRQVTGLEALLRWNNRELGSVSPAYFIPLAERTGFIFKIDEWVVREACRQLREWLDKGYAPVPVAINISARQFRSTKIVECIVKATRRYDIPPALLVVEMTEGALVHEVHAEHVLEKLREYGIGIHLDDFGTGYSSLSYLKKYPIDTIKIDRSFIREVSVNERDAKITTAIIRLAHTLGMEVIAEGVEEAEQVQFLQSQQAFVAQGYYFSKPLPKEEIESVCFKMNKKSDEA